MSNPLPWHEILRQAKSEASDRLQQLSDHRTLLRSPLHVPDPDDPAATRTLQIREADQEFYEHIRSAHRDRLLTVPQMTQITGLTRARIYQILNLPHATPVPGTIPADPVSTQLPETDV